MPFSVHHNVNQPISLYAATKKPNDLKAYAYSYQFGLSSAVLRFFTVYGPWGRPEMALFLFTKAILNGEPFIVFINGDMQIDFTHISYIVEGLVRVIYKTPEPNGNWNLGQPVPASSIAPYRIYNIGKSAPIGLNQFTNQNS